MPWHMTPSPTVGSGSGLSGVVAFSHHDAWAVGYRSDGHR